MHDSRHGVGGTCIHMKASLLSLFPHQKWVSACRVNMLYFLFSEKTNVHLLASRWECAVKYLLQVHIKLSLVVHDVNSVSHPPPTPPPPHTHNHSINSCSQLLCSESVVNYLSRNFISWAWDLTFHEHRIK